jgi:hypothetical protein
MFHRCLSNLVFDYVPKDERDSTYYKVTRDFYPIKVSDSGEYECLHNISSGNVATTISEKMNITVAGNLLYPLRARKLRKTFILDKDGNYPTKTTPPPEELTTPTNSSSNQKLFANLFIYSINILIAIILFIE